MMYLRLGLIVLLSFAATGFSNPLDYKTYEYYSERPSVTKVAAKKKHDYNNDFIRAQIEVAALLMTFYEQSDVYLLARDTEYLYDLIRLLEPTAKNAHLINVSRQHFDDSKRARLLTYLKEQGLSQEELRKRKGTGKKVVFMDTGFSGSIPYYLLKELAHGDESLLEVFGVHMLASEVVTVPAFRLFARYMDASITDFTRPKRFHRTVLHDLEHIAHYTHKSTDYRLTEGRMVPISEKAEHTKDPMNFVDRFEAVSIMESLRYAVEIEHGADIYAKRKQFYKKVLRDLKDPTKVDFVVDEFSMLASRESKETVHAMMLDILDWLLKVKKDQVMVSNLVAAMKQMKLAVHIENHEEIALTTLFESLRDTQKITFMESYPQYKATVLDPDVGVKKAIRDGKWDELLFILQNFSNDEFKEVLCQHLSSLKLKTKKETSQAETFLKTVWENKLITFDVFTRTSDEVFAKALIQYFTLNPSTSELYQRFIDQLFSKLDFGTLALGVTRTEGKNKQPSYLLVRLEQFLNESSCTPELLYHFQKYFFDIAPDNALKSLFLQRYAQLIQSLPPEKVTRLVNTYLKGETKKQTGDDADTATMFEEMRTGGSLKGENESILALMQYAARLAPGERKDFLSSAFAEGVIQKSHLQRAKEEQSALLFAPHLPFTVGLRFYTPEKRISLKVVKMLVDTPELKSMLAADANGLKYFVKVGESSSSSTDVTAISKEAQRLQRLQDKFRIESATVLEANAEFFVQEWVEGVTAAQWFQQWKATDFSREDPGFIALVELIKELAARRVHLSEFAPHDLVFDGQVWVVVGALRVKRSDYDASDILYNLLGRVETWGNRLDGCSKELLKKVLDQVE